MFTTKACIRIYGRGGFKGMLNNLDTRRTLVVDQVSGIRLYVYSLVPVHQPAVGDRQGPTFWTCLRTFPFANILIILLSALLNIDASQFLNNLSEISRQHVHEDNL